MDLDISKNTISESSVRYLADVLKKFQGFRAINMSNMAKLKDTAFIEMFQALRDNHSILKLDLSKNSLSHAAISELLLALQDNFVISEVIIDIKGASLLGSSGNLQW